MPFNRLSTTKIAKAVGCHPNTVRLYEHIGFIAPVPRSPKGYRLYTEEHLDQMRLARLAMEGAWPGPNIRRSLVELVRIVASQDYPTALEQAYHHHSVVRLELEQAETAAAFLETWAQGRHSERAEQTMQIGEVAVLLNLTTDTLRNWERSGLVTIPRSPTNRYRHYGPNDVGRVRVIRMLRQVGYSPMAILRMLVQLDQGQARDLRVALDTPRPDEDAYMAADRWLSTLAEHDQRARTIIDMVEAMTEKYGPAPASPIDELPNNE